MSKLRKEKSQMIFLQETHLSQSENEKLKNFGYKNTYYSTYKAGHKRVSILLHNSVNFELIKVIRDPEGRFLLLQGKIEDKLTTLFCVYLPPQSDQSVLKKIFDLLSSETQGVLICAGDFNSKLDTF